MQRMRQAGDGFREGWTYASRPGGGVEQDREVTGGLNAKVQRTFPTGEDPCGRYQLARDVPFGDRKCVAPGCGGGSALHLGDGFMACCGSGGAG